MSYFAETIDVPLWAVLLLLICACLRQWAANKAQECRIKLAELNQEMQIDLLKVLLAHAPTEVRCSAAGLKVGAEILRYEAEQFEMAMECVKDNP